MIKKLTCLIIILIITLYFNVNVTTAETNADYQSYINEFNEKRIIASELLHNAEEYLKDGDELNACATQQKASTYGIEATEALIKAMQINEATDGIENLYMGLNKWKELRDYC